MKLKTLLRARSFKNSKTRKITIPVKFLALTAVTAAAALSMSSSAEAYSLPAALVTNIPHAPIANTLEAKTAKHSLIRQTVSGMAVAKTLPKLPPVLTKSEVAKPVAATADAPVTISEGVDKLGANTPLATPMPDVTAAALPIAQPQPLPQPKAEAATVLSATDNAIKHVDGSAYPYANAPWPNESADPWGMYKRQCVSYTAWKVAASGRNMPYWGGAGDAKQWVSNARTAGIPVDAIPKTGDVAISLSGTYGHAMYVEGVNGDGTIDISQYNADFGGEYSTATRSTVGLLFIHFP